MRENQKYLEEIGVSNDTLDKIIRITDKIGFGSKITGAGGGGCVVSITDENTIKNRDRKTDKGANTVLSRQDRLRGSADFLISRKIQ